MNYPVKNILFIVKEDNALAIDAAKQAKTWCSDSNIKFSHISGLKCSCQQERDNFNNGQYDLVCAFGGDGTMLAAAELVNGSSCPIVGINFGHLGFLTNAHDGDWFEIFESAVNNQLKSEKRQCLDVEIVTECQTKKITCLNEVSVQRHLTGHAIDCNFAVNQHNIYHFRGDGILAASSTGSTAYALSSGGPIMAPSVPGIVVCPILPHTLLSRPLIIGLNDEINFRFPTVRNTKDLSVSVDGKFIELESKLLAVNVKASNKSVCFLTADPNDFYTRVGKIFY